MAGQTFGKEMRYVTNRPNYTSEQTPEIDMWLSRKDLWRTYCLKVHISMTYVGEAHKGLRRLYLQKHCWPALSGQSLD